jgi:cyclic pyranopterin phosphate synthase
MKINNTQSGRGYLLRASSNDRCNYDCLFCHPNENEPVDLLSNRAFTSILKVINDTVFLKALHFTGGEPLMRPGIEDLVAESRFVLGPEKDLALTTNGALLDSSKIQALKKSGLARLNISMHAFTPDKYAEFTRRPSHNFEKVKESITAAKQAGIKVKINMVAIKDFNEQDMLDILKFGFENHIIVRFLELGLYGPVCNWFKKKSFLSHADILQRITQAYGPFTRDLDTIRGNGPSKYYRNSSGNVFGILDNQSDPMCSGCDRFRITANGIIRACVFNTFINLGQQIENPSLMQESISKMVSLMNQRGQDYIGKRYHCCDYDFRWNKPSSNTK